MLYPDSNQVVFPELPDPFLKKDGSVELLNRTPEFDYEGTTGARRLIGARPVARPCMGNSMKNFI
jgi:hypothetical protein